ncbi:MAG: hypothetical protein ACYTFG_05065 [Planctomycetota bacterium]|jgi:hypothetical protein
MGHEFATACRERGENHGRFWARGYSIKRLETELSTQAGGPLGLNLHAEITVRQLAGEDDVDLGAEVNAFMEGFKKGIEDQLETLLRNAE